MRELKSRPADPRETKRRIEEAMRKHDREEPLTETERMVVYWLRHGGGCHACGGSPDVMVGLRRSGAG